LRRRWSSTHCSHANADTHRLAERHGRCCSS